MIPNSVPRSSRSSKTSFFLESFHVATKTADLLCIPVVLHTRQWPQKCGLLSSEQAAY